MTSTEPTRSASARRRRQPARQVAAAALAALTLATGCTAGLRQEATDEPERRAQEVGGVLDAWPDGDGDVLTSTSSPVEPDVAVAFHPVLLEDDGTATMTATITNAGTDDRSLFSVLGNAGLEGVTLRPAEGTARTTPFTTEAGDCACSADVATTIPAGGEATVFATFGGVDRGTEAVRVTLPGFRPADGIPVRRIEALAAGAEAATFAEDEPDHEVTVAGVWRTDAGLLVRVVDANGTDDPLSTLDLADLDTLRLADLGNGRLASPRERSTEVVASPDPEDAVAPGDSVTRDVLVAPLPDDSTEVVVLVDGLRRTLPVTIGEDAPDTSLDLEAEAAPAVTASLSSDQVAEPAAPIPVADVAAIGVDELGPALDTGDVVDELTSPAQPGWSIGPRSVVRTGDDQAVLFVDLARSASADATWPVGLAGDGSTSGLDGLALLDTERELRLGALVGDYSAFGSQNGTGVPEGTTRTVHVGFPAVDDDATSVTVDVPGFGQVADVPVLDAPDPAEDGDAVLASAAVERNAELRLDVLALGRLPDDAGTLLRFRSVNVADPDAIDAPFVSLGGCDLTLVDPDTNRRFESQDPCVATTWTAKLGNGEALDHEVRFPRIPADVERLVVDGASTLPTPAIALAEEADPWYLDLPRRADAPVGDTLLGSVGVADDLQTEVVEGDEINLQLDTDVLFDFGSATLDAAARARVEEVADRLAGEAAVDLVVTGHTDSVGDDAANEALSLRRAQAVADVLTAAGGGLQVTVEGEGEAQPVAANEIDGRDNPDGRARNRRVTITYTA